MAYAALVSLSQTLNQLLQHSDQDNQFPLQYYPKPQIESLHDKLLSLQSSLDKNFPVPKSIRNSVNDFEIQIRDAVYRAQDIIEPFISRLALEISESEENSLQSSSSLDFLQHLQEIIAMIDLLTEEAERIEASIRRDHKDELPTDDASLSIKSASRRSKSKIVGQEEDQVLVTVELMNYNNKLQVVPITGMPGVGKTTLAKSIYEDPRIQRHFVTRAWVTVSQEYCVRDIYLKLLHSMESNNVKSDVDNFSQKNEGELALDLHQKLFDTRYLIVIDDMWDKSIWNEIRKCFFDDKNGSRILLTTRIADVADYCKSSDFCHHMSLLDEVNSWELLCANAFLEGLCPPSLVAIGREISNNCKGLPLALTVVGGLLYKGEKTRGYWEIVAEDTNAAAVESEDGSYKEILSLSYNHLPGRLKGCFLYMGAFPEDSQVLASKLIQLWVAEGFLTPSPYQSLEQVAENYLKELVDRNFISVRKFSSDGRIKTCGMHDILRDLAMDEGRKNKFFHSIYRYNQYEQEGRNSQRRLFVHKNILMCLEEVYNSAKSIKFSRSLLYTGSHHHHPMPFCLTFDLLRVLDTFTVYFSSFPIEIVKLIHLRYLALTYNGKLPKSISKLRNLQVLIVRRHPKIIILGTSFLPVEIWNMPQLRHLLFTESCLPDISGLEFSAHNCVLLENLQTLSNVNASCLTKKVLQHTPNLKKLGVWVEGPGALEFYIDVLQQLEAFKFTVLNPIPGSKIDFLPALAFPTTLRKLSLTGCGIPWKHMKVIAELPNLEVLKLREFAFRGPEWEPEPDTIFFALKFLLLEALDLEYWGADYTHFPSLERLIIRHCYKLEQMNPEIGDIGALELIELVDCSPYAADWAEYVKDEQQDAGNTSLQVRIYSPWE